jgi:hypothetical protein
LDFLILDFWCVLRDDGYPSFLHVPGNTSKVSRRNWYVVLPFILMIDVLFDENIPPWKTRSGPLRMDEKAARIQGGDKVGKRSNSDTTLQQDESVEKPAEPENIDRFNEQRMDRNVDTV